MTKENAVTVIEPEQAAPPAVVEPMSVIAIIERAVRDPSVDIDKMERLLAMHERIEARRAKAEYNAALAELQPKLPVIGERGAIKNNADKVQSRYALWEDIVTGITPMLSAHGFALSFRVGKDGENQTVTGILSHKGGHSEETTLTLPRDMSGSKNAVQGVGSTVSYGKRYVTQSLLNLVSRGEDDDGQGGGGNQAITAEQKAELVALLQETGSDTVKFLAHFKLAAIDDMRANDFKRAKSMVEAKRKKAS